jgi:hypothetical protein
VAIGHPVHERPLNKARRAYAVEEVAGRCPPGGYGMLGGREVAQFGSALRSGRRGRGFKSRLPDEQSPGQRLCGRPGAQVDYGTRPR